MYKIFIISFLLMMFSSSAYAIDDDTKAYYNAYNFCSPSAQKQTMNQCNYSRLVEGYYTSCMSQKGFGDSEETMDKRRYADYLQTYRQCSVIANSAAQNECNYGIVYQGFYNKCMAEYGFDYNGDRITAAARPNQKSNEIPSQAKKDETDRNPVGKYFDSIF